MRANVKPLTHWVIYKEYSVRFTARTAEAVAGWLTVPGGAQVAFTYDPGGRVITLPDRRITSTDLQMIAQLVVNNMVMITEQVLELPAERPEAEADLIDQAAKQLRVIFLGVSQWNKQAPA